TWEEILEDENRFSLIKECNILIDGKYMDNLKDLNLKWRGSSNQRVIDIKKSLETNEIIEYI
ncbi:4Fe-4S cluster-binding domain-containing protein, partial [Fusobacterium pseudoperiodonticum]|uniref:4Fe-4S cluster-binding domain-containing protein n=1 Tax=Fusobacterium pseudoperiodonticum TaxID=2663009 RepID=UPI0028D45CE5